MSAASRKRLEGIALTMRLVRQRDNARRRYLAKGNDHEQSVTVTCQRRDGLDTRTVVGTSRRSMVDALHHALRGLDGETWAVAAISTPASILTDVRGARNEHDRRPGWLLLGRAGMRDFLR